MGQSPHSISLDADRYLDGPLGEGADPFANGWTFRPDDNDDAEEAPLPREHGEVLASLGLVYLRHGDPARAMVLGLAAMSMGDLTPATILLVGESMLLAGDPEQAMTVLTRFDRDGGLSAPPNAAERAARHYLAARILHRREETEAARAELALARAEADNMPKDAG
ncbi:hypothetical protein [Paracoccus laeviglucosivorans]|uniref:Tetratricopeptide repeat-containing protein n=1 Tax=Paracoccus laeviglucosivorans TaxID=1197861 RepID=A0A521BDG1_9RHOB|nr:hypothetical protein [Paracoccus laeviglucosivorans]SMO45112.1 hypothetical protein SAMN06265221_102245 [Paracoccus laeviglucosivorans]